MTPVFLSAESSIHSWSFVYLFARRVEETENDRRATAGEGRKAGLIAGAENREATGRKLRAIEAIVVGFVVEVLLWEEESV